MASTRTPLNALIVEDVPENAARLVARLEHAGFDVTGRRVGAEDYLEEVQSTSPPDIIIADDRLPERDALRAIQQLQRVARDIPFLVVTERTDPERATSCLRAGAFDYLYDAPPDELASTVSRALDQGSASRKLRESEELLGRTLAGALDAVVVADAEGRILDWNPQAEKTFGWSREEVLGRTLASTIVPPRLRDEHVAGMKRFLETGTSRILNQRVEMTGRRRDGAEIPVELSVTPIRLGERRIFSAFLRDLSDKKHSEKERELLQVQLLQSQKMEAVGLLAGGVAHDFNNILTVIMGQSQLVLNSSDLTPELRERVSVVSRAAARASSLTTQLLAFSRRQVLSPTVLALNEVIEHMQDLLARVIGEDIVIETDFAEELGLIEADRAQIEQVVLNLVVNARDAMPKGGKLTLTTRSVVIDEREASLLDDCEPGRYVSLRVRDRGVGMDAAVMAKIFEPFFTTKERGRGTGLGLSTVYGIVKQSGGATRVSSEKGRGTVFEVLLPEARGEPLPSSDESSSAPGGEGRILIVEDDDSVRALAQEVLAIAGYEVIARPGAREALGVIEKLEGEVDLVITDLVLKGMNGKELAGLITKRFPKVAILFLSGYHNHPFVDSSSTDHPIVRKPFIPHDLTRAVSDRLAARDPADLD